MRSSSRPTWSRIRPLSEPHLGVKPWALLGCLLGLTWSLASCGGADSSQNGQRTEQKTKRSPEAGPRPGPAPVAGGRSNALPRPGQALSNLTPAAQRAIIRLAVKAQRHRPTTHAGCQRYSIRRAPKPQVGPPAPSLSARRTGERVTVTYRFSSLPRSAACRPFAVFLAVRSASPGLAPRGESYRLDGRNGRHTVVGPSGKAPYTAIGYSVTVTNLRSRVTSAPVQ
jgi:hypothetical protein